MQGDRDAHARPRVSVCIPTIDRPDLLREAIASVARQTGPNFEIVIGDNSGDAELHRRIDAVLAEFPELTIRLTRNAERVEAAENFNRLIDAATGEFWVCLPDDDHLCQGALARAVDALDAHPECAFSFADHWIMRADGTLDEAATRANSWKFSRHLLREGVYRHGELFGLALKQSMCLQTAVFRRTVLAGVRFMSGIMLLDQSLFLRLSASAEPIHAYYIPDRVFEYRVWQMQTTSTTKRERLLRETIAAFESVQGVPAGYGRDLRARLSREYLALALVEAEEGATRSARDHAAKSLRLAPGLRSALGGLLVSLVPASIPIARRIYGRFGGSLSVDPMPVEPTERR